MLTQQGWVVKESIEEIKTLIEGSLNNTWQSK
jgi:hypothetical protein